MTRRFVSIVLLACVAMFGSAPAEAAPAAPVRVRLQTSEGPIVIELEMKRAPITATNFLRYAEEKRFDGTRFYRAARGRSSPKIGFIPGGVHHDAVRSRLPIAQIGRAHV